MRTAPFSGAYRQNYTPEPAPRARSRSRHAVIAALVLAALWLAILLGGERHGWMPSAAPGALQDGCKPALLARPIAQVQP